jgi:hypothetical protein
MNRKLLPRPEKLSFLLWVDNNHPDVFDIDIAIVPSKRSAIIIIQPP